MRHPDMFASRLRKASWATLKKTVKPIQQENMDNSNGHRLGDQQLDTQAVSPPRSQKNTLVRTSCIPR